MRTIGSVSEQVARPHMAAHSDSELSVRILRTVAEIEAIRPMWGAWPGHRDSDIDFFLAVLRSNSRILRPHVMVAERGVRPEAILVGRVDRGPVDFRVGYVRLRPKADVLYFVYGAQRGSCSSEISRLFLEEIQLCLARGEADAVYLNFLRTDSEMYKLATTSLGFLSRDHISAPKPHFRLTVPHNVEQLYAGLSSKVRKNQRRQARKLLDDFHGAVRVQEFRAISEVASLAEAAEQVAKKSYQRGMGVGFVDCPEERERLMLAAAKRWLRGYVLYLAEKPCAFWIGVLSHGTFLSDYLGHDPEFAKHSPGMYLVMKTLESFTESPVGNVTEVDFATGDAQYKEVLANHEWQESPVYIFSKSWKGVQLSVLRSLSGGINEVGKKVLKQTKLLQRIKKSWRSRIGNSSTN
jgi:hypothetical protein